MVESPASWLDQEKIYNGWKLDHYINSIFLFTVDGKISVAVINTPGSFYHSTIADYGAYSQFKKVYRLYGVKVVVDSAFQFGIQNWSNQSSQIDPVDAEELILNREAMSLRQLSEWGMRMIQVAFPRLKEALPSEDGGEREIIIQLMIRLHNFAAENMGLNQIFNSFINTKDKFYSYMIEPDYNNHI